MENNSKKMKKDSRWDKIRKRYNNNQHHFNITTDNVKKFLELDFVGQNEMKILNGNDIKNTLSPADIMDIRHNSIRGRDKFNSVEIHFPDDPNLLIEQKQQFHNESLERVAIDNEIKKFRNELKKFQKLGTHRGMNRKIQINNKIIYENILKFRITTKDFYQTCAKAPLLSAELSGKGQELDERLIENQSEIYRSVRFEKNIEIMNECDNRKVICLNSLYEVDTETTTETSTNEDIYEEKTSSVLSDISLDDDPSLIEEPKLMIEDVDSSNEKQKDLLVISRIGISGPSIQPDVPQTTERDRIIDSLFNPKFYKCTREYELKVLRKYFQKWLVMTSFSKINGKCLTNNENRVKKINEFLTKIRDEKKKAVKLDQDGEPIKQAPTIYKQKSYIDPVLLSKKYQHKLKVQQDTIELQKAKLERQERMITELKLAKMFDESKFSKNEIKTELDRAMKFGTVKLRGKAKCLQVVGNFKSNTAAIEIKKNDEEKKLQASGNEMPKFLAKMQARALERHLKHEEARQKRERQEKEKEEAKTAAEEAKRLEDEQAKNERHEALREKRRQEKLQKIQKEKDHAKYLANVKKANEYYRRKMLMSIMARFKKIVEAKRLKEQRAKILRKRLIQKNSFSAWQQLTRQIWEKKRKCADQFYVCYIVKYTFRAWKKQLLIAQSKYMVAVDLYELRLSEKVLKYWNILTKQHKLLEQHKMLQAESHYNWHLKWKVIEHWQRLHTILKIERETEERRQRWRMKIWELLPDYQPNPDNYI